MATEILLLLGRLLLVFFGSALFGIVLLVVALLLMVILPTHNPAGQELHEAVTQFKGAVCEAILTSRLGRFLGRLIGGDKRG